MPVSGVLPAQSFTYYTLNITMEISHLYATIRRTLKIHQALFPLIWCNLKM